MLPESGNELRSHLGPPAQTRCLAILGETFGELKPSDRPMVRAGGDRSVCHFADGFEVRSRRRENQAVLSHPLGDYRIGRAAETYEDRLANPAIPFQIATLNWQRGQCVIKRVIRGLQLDRFGKVLSRLCPPTE